MPVMNPTKTSSHPDPERAAWMSLLAKAPLTVLAQRAACYGPIPEYLWLRMPEVGLAMVRGRTGGTGTQFNVGEMSVTRCALRLETGEMGIGYVAGRNKRHAELAALFDALMHTDVKQKVREVVLQPIESILAAQRAHTIAMANATKVEFMTMVRGEDA